MKIIHIITKMHEIYGAQRHTIECVRNHVKKQHKCLVIAGTDGYSSNEIKKMGVEVVIIPEIKNAYNLVIDSKAISQMVSLLKVYKPDIVISHSSKAGILARVACFITKTPNIFTVHGWAFERGTPLLQRTIAHVIELMLIPISDIYVCVSRYTLQFGMSKLPLNKRRVYACPNMHQESLEILSKSSEITNNVLMVGGFREQKDHLTALRALKVIVEERKLKHLHFTFVGDGPKRKVIEDYINQNKLDGYITLAGETKDINSFYQNADIVILPTYYEGLPLSLIEAIQQGIPIIATDTGGIKEIVLNNENGNLIAIEDYKALANHITDYYINDKISKLSINAKEIYDTIYSYHVVSESLNRVIDEALTNSVYKRKKIETRIPI